VTVKAGICVAYDWALLEHSLPAIYPYIDFLCLSVDVDRRSWNGNNFEMDWIGFMQLVKSVDREGKIKILEESFYSSQRTPIENECYQRKRMSEFMGKADWYVQIDADEILFNATDLIQELKKYKQVRRSVNIHGIWINLIKQTEAGFVYSVVKTPPLATNQPVYNYGRTNGHFNIYTNTFLAHITWARPEEEVYYKLKNWGHSHEFNGMSFYKIWKALDEYNWIYIKDFHPMNKGHIPQLHFQKARDLNDFVQTFDTKLHLLSAKEQANNNIWFSRLNKLLARIKG
jgi:hypothetical protein